MALIARDRDAPSPRMLKIAVASFAASVHESRLRQSSDQVTNLSGHYVDSTLSVEFKNWLRPRFVPFGFQRCLDRAFERWGPGCCQQRSSRIASILPASSQEFFWVT